MVVEHGLPIISYLVITFSVLTGTSRTMKILCFGHFGLGPSEINWSRRPKPFRKKFTAIELLSSVVTKPFYAEFKT